mmetsp:Transcript_47854/g.86317  ORF Transcript_47854/g.86317 Transcript_47854/m.86317 type:complete len:209 (+) Transcript_47854:474-1100(+)
MPSCRIHHGPNNSSPDPCCRAWGARLNIRICFPLEVAGKRSQESSSVAQAQAEGASCQHRARLLESMWQYWGLLCVVRHRKRLLQTIFHPRSCRMCRSRAFHNVFIPRVCCDHADQASGRNSHFAERRGLLAGLRQSRWLLRLVRLRQCMLSPRLQLRSCRVPRCQEFHQQFPPRVCCCTFRRATTYSRRVWVRLVNSWQQDFYECLA